MVAVLGFLLENLDFGLLFSVASRANLVVFAFFKQPPFLSLKGLVPLLVVSSLDSIALLFISLALPHGLKCIIIDDILDYGRV